MNNFVGTVPSAKKYCCNYRQWRHFVAITTPMSLKPYDKFSSISNKTMVAIFPNVCLWRRSYAQNWEVLTPKNCYSIKPTSYASTAYVVASFGLVSFLLFCENLGNLREFFGQIVYRPPPPLAKNCPYAYE